MGCFSVCFTQLQEKKKNNPKLLHDSVSSSFFSAFTVTSTQILHSVYLLKQLYFLPPFLHLYFFLMSNSDSKLFLSFIPISDSLQSPAHVLIFLAELYSANAFVSLAREKKNICKQTHFPSELLRRLVLGRGRKVLCQVLEEEERHLLPPDIPLLLLLGRIC